jgi:hypothetical protein
MYRHKADHQTDDDTDRDFHCRASFSAGLLANLPALAQPYDGNALSYAV